MNAKEWIKGRGVPLTSDRTCELMEQYYLAKSKEEAEERYKKALSYYDNETYMNGKSITAVVNALRIASGKESN